MRVTLSRQRGGGIKKNLKRFASYSGNAITDFLKIIQTISDKIILKISIRLKLIFAGKNIAEFSLQILLINMVTRFRWGWRGTEDLDSISLLINKPDQPIRLKFERLD